MVNPKFEIDRNGRVLCKIHTNYEMFKDSPSPIDLIGITLRDRKLTCETCSYYKKDNCYFSKNEIDGIIRNKNWFHRKFKCEICNSRITLLFSILQKLFLKKEKNVDISLICCTCNILLQSGKPRKNALKIIWYLLIPFIWFLVFLPFLFSYFHDILIVLYITLTLSVILIYPIIFILRTIKRSKYIKTHFPEGIPEENIKTDDWVTEMVEGTLKYFIHKFQKRKKLKSEKKNERNNH